jgi:hypothetical protein
MPPVFIVLYTIMLLAALFAICFVILRYNGMTNRQAAVAMAICLVASFVINVAFDMAFPNIGFIR